jgi:monoamine oxidase
VKNGITFNKEVRSIA